MARRFDGTHSPHEIADELNREAPGTTTAEDVAELAGSLLRKGLLDADLAADGLRTPGTRFHGTWLQLRWSLLDPDRALQKLVIPLAPLLSLPALAGILGLIAYATALHVIHGGVMLETLHAALSGVGPLWIVAATAFSLTLHELAHGLTARRLGAEVHEMGLLLLLLVIPCAYTDVSDAYLLPRKRDRILVSLAGTIVDLLGWSLATILVVLFEPTGSIRQLLGAWMMATGVRTVAFNLNPLLKLDGYYVLVDLLEMPNLRPRSRAVLMWRVRRFLFRDAAPSPEPSGELVILEIYGWAAALYLAALPLLVWAVHLGG